MVFFVPFGIIACTLALLGFHLAGALFMYKIAQGWARVVINMTGCRVTVRGREHIPPLKGLFTKGAPSEGVCFVSNHGSIFDIVLALAYVGRPFGFIAKRELLFVPFLNMWIYILGGLFIDRKHPRKALATINGGVRRLKTGGGILIFPEGHRSRGQGLLPFHPGSFKLATHSGVAIIPIAIAGSYSVFEKTGRVQAVPVEITFLSPIRPDSLPPGDRRQILAGEVRSVIEKTLIPSPPPLASFSRF